MELLKGKILALKKLKSKTDTLSTWSKCSFLLKSFLIIFFNVIKSN